MKKKMIQKRGPFVLNGPALFIRVKTFSNQETTVKYALNGDVNYITFGGLKPKVITFNSPGSEFITSGDGRLLTKGEFIEISEGAVISYRRESR